jgi:uroporphyrinogen decarboxylase
MEPERLKGEFGDRLSFHGGVDTQKFLPFATTGKIDQEVKRLMGIFGKGGGYLAASCHTIQPDVPPENALAMFKAFKQHGVYPLSQK